MGYSVSVKFKNETEQENMHQFLLDNEDILNQMEQIELNNPLYLPCDNIPSVGENLGYAPNKKYLLGFHGTGIPEYIWDLCAWMSIKAGSKFKGQHYFYYDSEKQIVSFDIHNSKNFL